MNNKDLQQILTNGENEAVEFKASFNMGVIESLSAFSNSKGGTVFVGVTDAGKICGVALAAESIPQWCNEIKSKTEPVLLPDVDIEDLQTDSYRASTRNKLIAEAFYLTKDIEKYCSGFTRIRSMIADYPTMKFEYRNADYGFFAEFSYTEQKISTQKNVTDNVTEKVTERVTERVTDKVTENQQKILIEIEKNPYISQAKLSVLIGISRIHINKNISLLKSKGILTRIGPDRGGYWQINKQKEEHDE